MQEVPDQPATPPPPPEPAAPPTTGQPRTLFPEHCTDCGANLANRSFDDLCASCGRPVNQSLPADLLRFSDPSDIVKLRNGCILVLASLLLTLGMGVAAMVYGMAVGARAAPGQIPPDAKLLTYAFMGVTWIGVGLSAWGWFLLTVPPRSGQRGNGSRRLIRTTVLVSLVVTLISTIIGLFSAGGMAAGQQVPTWSLGDIISSVLWFVLFTVQFFASMHYLQQLAARIPSVKLEDTARRFKWLLPVVAIPGALVLFLGPLIAMIMYYNLINDFRKNLGKVLTRTATPQAR